MTLENTVTAKTLQSQQFRISTKYNIILKAHFSPSILPHLRLVGVRPLLGLAWTGGHHHAPIRPRALLPGRGEAPAPTRTPRLPDPHPSVQVSDREPV